MWKAIKNKSDKARTTETEGKITEERENIKKKKKEFRKLMVEEEMEIARMVEKKKEEEEELIEIRTVE